MQSWLLRRARTCPNRVALIGEGQRLTFADVAREATNRAAKFTSFGIPTHRRVGFLAGNSVEFYLWLMACQHLGIQAVLLNIRLSPEELAAQISKAEVSLVLCDEAHAATAATIAPAAICFTDLANYPPSPEVEIVSDVDLDTVTTILFTSGTTGEAKGVMQTFGNHWWSAMGSMLNLGVDPSKDSWICSVPLFHISGLSIVMRGLIYGIAVHLQPRFDPTAMNKLLLSGEATTTSVVPQMLVALLADLGNCRYPDTVRCVLLGGGFIDDASLETCRTLGIPLVFSFGMTETASQCIALPLADVARKQGSAGLPLSGVDVRISSGHDPHVTGEIQLRSPTLTVGYVGEPERYAASFSDDGWFCTGDVGYLDEDGYLFVVTRLAEMIISGGENIYPAEVENCLLSHPQVADVAVVGRSDLTWGQVPIAFVVPQERPVTAEELLDHARAHIARYKVPAEIIFVDALPRTASGKVRRVALIDQTTHRENR